jgi:hypothetical protein
MHENVKSKLWTGAEDVNMPVIVTSEYKIVNSKYNLI